MAEITIIKKNIVFLYLEWHFFDAPKEILKAWRNFILFGLNYFSIPLLLRTFFSPWRGYRWHQGRGFSLGSWLEALFSNLISRTLGAAIRFVLILLGIIAEFFILFGGAAVLALWLLSPAVLIFLLIFGFNLLT